MSFYIDLQQDELQAFLAHYDLGDLNHFQLLTPYSVHSHYLIVTSKAQYVLTLFVDLTHAEVDFYQNLMLFLSHHNIPCAIPQPDRHGEIIRELKGYQSIISSYLYGQPDQQFKLEHSAAIGDFLGKFHLISQGFSPQRANIRGEVWHRETIEQLMDLLPLTDALLLQEELGFHKTIDYEILPRGIIHGDVSPANVLFSGDVLTGIVHFEYACTDNLLLDLAIAVNAWCQNDQGKIDEQRMNIMRLAYEKHRPFTPLEKQNWLAVRRTAAFRVWLLRLLNLYFPQDTTLPISDPKEYKQLLIQLSFIPNL